jgi:polyhydroxyalkanoate synthase
MAENSVPGTGPSGGAIPGLPRLSTGTVDDVVARVRTLYTHLVGGGLADLSRTPSEVILDEPHTRVLHYLPEAPVDEAQLPALLVPPVNTASSTMDLRRGNSMAEHLMLQGRPTYLVDYGELSTRQHAELDLSVWLDDILPTAIQAVSRRHGGRQVHLVGWCLGGILATFVAAEHAQLPVASVAMVASPWDFTALGKFEPIRLLGKVTGGKVEHTVFRVVGGVPGKINTLAFKFADPVRLAKKPYFLVKKSGDPDVLAQIEAVDAMMDAMEAYPGRTIRQIYENFVRTSNLREGRMALRGGRTVSLDGLSVPVLNVAGTADNIFAPREATHHLARLVPDDLVTLAEAPGGHMGVLTGPRAATTTWPIVDDFLSSADTTAETAG